MRNVSIALAVGVVLVILLIPSKLAALMDGGAPFEMSSGSGIININPEERSATDIKDFYESGKITVVEFHDEKCPRCREIFGFLQKLNAVRPDVSIKLIHMSKGSYGYWGERYGLNVPHVPFTVLLDGKGEIIAADDGMENEGYDLMLEWINAEIKRDWESNN